MAILAALEGLPVLAWLGLIPSDSSSAFIWGLSKQRLVLLAICLLLFIALACLAVIIVKSPCRLITLEEWLRKYLIERHNLVPVALSALYIAIFGVAVTIFSAALSPDQYGWFWSWAGYQFSTLHIVILRILPFIAWASALALECFLLIVIRFGSQFKDRAFWQTRPILVTGVCLLAATATLIHWTILAFQLEVFKKIPGYDPYCAFRGINGNLYRRRLVCPAPATKAMAQFNPVILRRLRHSSRNGRGRRPGHRIVAPEVFHISPSLLRYPCQPE
jgi:hypothetical protein